MPSSRQDMNMNVLLGYHKSYGFQKANLQVSWKVGGKLWVMTDVRVKETEVQYDMRPWVSGEMDQRRPPVYASQGPQPNGNPTERMRSTKAPK
jgi:hypothetical protein